MADVITRLKVESSEYDSKIQRAAKGIQALETATRSAGKTMADASKEEVEFVRALGQMETVSNDAKGKIGELTKAFTNLSVQYNNLTKQEKQSPYGKALAGSLDQLKGRIQGAKSEISKVEGSLGSFGDAAKNMASKLGLPVEQLAKFGPAGAAAALALKVATDAFKQNELIMDEFGRETEEAKGIYTGFLNALNTGDFSSFFSNLDKIRSSARAAYDALDELGTFNAFNQIQTEAARTGFTDAVTNYREGSGTIDDVKVARDQLVGELEKRQKKEQDVYKKAIEQWANDHGGLNAELLERVLAGDYGGYEAVKNIGQNQGVSGTGRRGRRASGEKSDIAKLGEALQMMTDDELGILQGYGAQAQRTATEVASIKKQASRIIEGDKNKTEQAAAKAAKPQEDAEKRVKKALEDYATALNLATLRKESGLDDEKDYKTKELQAHERLFDAYADAYNTYADPKYKEAMDQEAEAIKELAKTVKELTDAEADVKKSTQELDKANREKLAKQKQLDNSILSGLTSTAKKAGWTSADIGTTGIKTKIEAGVDITEDEWKVFQDKLNERLKSLGMDPIQINFETGNIEEIIDKTKQKMEEFMSTMQSGVGAVSTIGNAFNDLKGIGEDLASAFSGEMDAWDAMMTVFNSGIGVIQTVMSVMEAINTLTEISAALKEKNAIAATTEAAAVVAGKGTETAATTAEMGVEAAATGVTAGKAAASAGDAVAGIPFVGPVLAVAAVAAVLAAILASVSKAKSSAGSYATGGLIGGNSFSGDNLTANVNSGELILNRAQQGAIAGQLQSNPMGNLRLSTEISGSNLRVVLNNDNRQRGGSRNVYGVH